MKYVLFFIVPFCLVNCSGKKNIPPKVEPIINKGTVTTIYCLSAPTEDYVVYIPTNTTDKKLLPVIVFFDSHGKGSFPVQKYKELGEKYGMVLVGSNKIKNGMDINNVITIYVNLIFDLKKRISIDAEQLYLSGFSGGARMASIIAITQNKITGVIACSAGLDPSLLQSKPSFSYVGIAGKYDMNCNEMVNLDDQMDQVGANHQLLLFNGKHEWPPLDVMDEAFMFMRLSVMKNNSTLQNDSIIKKSFAYFVQKETKKASVLTTLKLEKQIVNYFDGLMDVELNKKRINELTMSSELKKAIDDEAIINKKENDYKQKLINAFGDKKIDWWKKEIHLLHEKIQSSSESESAMYQRMLGFASLASFSNVNYAIKNKKREMAEHYLQIYSLVDPENPDCSYFYGCFYVLKNDYPSVIKCLNESIDKGFTDLDRIYNEPLFESIKNNTEFITIVNRLR